MIARHDGSHPDNWFIVEKFAVAGWTFITADNQYYYRFRGPISLRDSQNSAHADVSNIARPKPPRLMCGCPLRCKAVFERYGHVIGCGHVSGLGFAALHMPRAGMEMGLSKTEIARQAGGKDQAGLALDGGQEVASLGVELHEVALSMAELTAVINGLSALSAIASCSVVVHRFTAATRQG